MKFADGWYWPDGEQHMLEWIAHPKNRMVLNGRPAYQGKKQLAVIAECGLQRRMRVAVDVGAHIGLWSFNLARAFESVKAFEPVAAHRECFVKNVEDCEEGGNVDLIGCAIGPAEARVSIWSNPTSSGDSWVSGVGGIPMRTLDSFALQDVDLIKADCEGYEEKVLRGAFDTIARCRPIIMVEQKRDMAEKFGMRPQGGVEFLQSLGYSVKAEIGGDYLMVPA